MSRDRPVGILAGAGRYPLHLVNELHRQQRTIVVVALKGVSVAAIAQEADICRWLRVGQLRAAARYFIECGATEVIMAGGVPWNVFTVRPCPDGIALRALVSGFFGDDRLLRRVATLLEKCGLTIIDPVDSIGALVVPPGLVGGPPIGDDQRGLIEQGWRIASDLGRRDRGQAVVVSRGGVLLEDRGGTDRLLNRARQESFRGGVLVKVAKPNQDRRFDLPAIGPATITASARVGLSTVVVEAGATLLIDREEANLLANRLSVSLVALENPNHVLHCCLEDGRNECCTAFDGTPQVST